MNTTKKKIFSSLNDYGFPEINPRTSRNDGERLKLLTFRSSALLHKVASPRYESHFNSNSINRNHDNNNGM